MAGRGGVEDMAFANGHITQAGGEEKCERSVSFGTKVRSKNAFNIPRII